MSQRTIIEINHDFIAEIEAKEILADLLYAIKTGDADAWEFVEDRGIRKIVQRHHSSAGFVHFEDGRMVSLP